MAFNRIYDICSKLAKLFYTGLFKVEVIGAEHIDFNAQYVVCANHLSMHDPFLLGGFLPFQAHFMAKKELFKYKIVAWFLGKIYVFPVDRGNNDIKAIKNALTLLRSGENLGLFPEGTRNFGKTPLPVKGGVAMLSIKTETPILPITIDTTYKFFSPIRVIFHSPIAYSEYYGQKVDAEVMEALSTGIVDALYKERKYFKEQ